MDRHAQIERVSLSVNDQVQFTAADPLHILHNVVSPPTACSYLTVCELTDDTACWLHFQFVWYNKHLCTNIQIAFVYKCTNVTYVYRRHAVPVVKAVVLYYM